jgi:hypothetical protein
MYLSSPQKLKSGAFSGGGEVAPGAGTAGTAATLTAAGGAPSAGGAARTIRELFAGAAAVEDIPRRALSSLREAASFLWACVARWLFC